MASSNGRSFIVLGVCAMAKKATSKPMKQILERLTRFSHIHVIIFDEKVIIENPIEEWPICDALLSFFSKGFPLEKAISYSKLREPFLLNDLASQYILKDRKAVYEVLQEEAIPVPKHAFVIREPGKPAPNLIETDDAIEIDGVVFNKPFVEKPICAEEHDISIYYPSTVGGGKQQLFRKTGDRSSVYNLSNTLRTDGSYLYEQFMPTDGTDVKVYTVGVDYAHAEARKSPALDGKVERDREGKEVRYPVILTPHEKLIAKKVVTAFKQKICGFDLLRAQGESYVCDVNGFSFVKSSAKYYDDCSNILATMLTKQCAPESVHLLPVSLANPAPLVPTTWGPIMELRCVLGVIRHGDRTPKQKMKMEVRHKAFFDLFDRLKKDDMSEVKLKRPAQLQEVLDLARRLLEEIDSGNRASSAMEAQRAKLEQLKNVLEMHGCFSGINRKVQLKYLSRRKASNNSNDSEKDPRILMVVKWGGELTEAGIQQAEALGKAFRCLYPGRTEEKCDQDGTTGKLSAAQRDQETGLLRLHSTYRHDLKIYASDEGRVQMTAAAFTRGFLALEGELPPILMQMVKKANTNSLLDNENVCRKGEPDLRQRIRSVMLKEGPFTAEDYEKFVPSRASSVITAMRLIRNPREALRRLHQHVSTLVERIGQVPASTRAQLSLYQGESWDLLTRRWKKLLKDFRPRDGDVEFDLSKICDIYDNIKYDIQHNSGVIAQVEAAEARDFFQLTRALANIMEPQENGLTAKEKLSIGMRVCTPLLRKLLSDANYPNADDFTRLNAAYSNGVSSPDRFVRTRLYFTSKSHVLSLLNCIRFGDLMNASLDRQWRRAMNYVGSVSEINYLSQIVIMIFEDPSVDYTKDDRFHVEVHFSPGAYPLILDAPKDFQELDSLADRLEGEGTAEVAARSSERVCLRPRRRSCDGESRKHYCTSPNCLTQHYQRRDHGPEPALELKKLPKRRNGVRTTSLDSTCMNKAWQLINTDYPIAKLPEEAGNVSPTFWNVTARPTAGGFRSGCRSKRMRPELAEEPLCSSALFPNETYYFDMRRLSRALALGQNPQPPICRSLISTAIIHGYNESDLKSVPNRDASPATLSESLNREDKIPIDLRPGNRKASEDEDSFIGSAAPSVPGVYPLETLSNGLTLPQLTTFLQKLVDRSPASPLVNDDV